MNKKMKFRTGIAPGSIWLLRFAIFFFPFIVVGATAIKTRFFPGLNLLIELTFSVVLPVAILYFTSLQVSKVSCPRCHRPYYSRNIFKTAFGSAKNCSQCKN